MNDLNNKTYLQKIEEIQTNVQKKYKGTNKR